MWLSRLHVLVLVAEHLVLPLDADRLSGLFLLLWLPIPLIGVNNSLPILLDNVRSGLHLPVVVLAPTVHSRLGLWLSNASLGLMQLRPLYVSVLFGQLLPQLSSTVWVAANPHCMVIGSAHLAQHGVVLACA